MVHEEMDKEMNIYLDLDETLVHYEEVIFLFIFCKNKLIKIKSFPMEDNFLYGPMLNNFYMNYQDILKLLYLLLLYRNMLILY